MNTQKHIKLVPFKHAHLTEKEIEIIQLICKEFSNKEIANKMNHSVRTIEGYREKILEKIKAKNTAGIVVFAIKNDLFII